jgi:plastocyanin
MRLQRTHLPVGLVKKVQILVVSAVLLGSCWVSKVYAQASSSIKGVVKFQGSTPKGTPIDMSVDPYCKKMHPGMVFTEDVVVAAGGALANALVFVSDGLGDRTFAAPGAPVVLEQKGCNYTPHIVAMQTNQKLDVVNDDDTTHNIHPLPNNNREWNKTQPHGVPIEESFAREEVPITVKCNIHPWMRGYIAVFHHPFFAITNKSGEFEIKDLPPGTYTIKVWQEKLGTLTQSVTVGGGETKPADFVFKGGS